MKRNKLINSMSKKNSFNRDDLKNAIKNDDPDYSLENVSSLLESYIKKGLIVKEDTNKYSVISDKQYYIYNMSEKLREIHDYLVDKYPNVKFQAWEFSQLNEFLNHLLSTTTYVIEVEGMFVESVFEMIKEAYDSVLLTPTPDDFFRYAKSGTIVVKKLISESPTDKDAPHQIRLEKLLVDIIVDRFTAKIISSSEINDTFEYCLKHYFIDERTLLRYAKRRNAQIKVNNVLNTFKGATK